jgi:hypothetical protein
MQTFIKLIIIVEFLVVGLWAVFVFLCFGGGGAERMSGRMTRQNIWDRAERKQMEISMKTIVDISSFNSSVAVVSSAKPDNRSWKKKCSDG